MRRSFCKCAVSKRRAPFVNAAAACGQNAAVPRRIRDRPDRMAATLPRHAASGKRRLPQKAIPFRVRHARRTPARRSHRRPPRGGRIQPSNTSAKSQRETRQRQTQRQAHGEGMRHAALPCEEPPSEAATRTVLRTVCAPARAFSDGTERWCGCRAKSHRGGILRATDAAQRRFSVAGITRTVCHNHTILWRK